MTAKAKLRPAPRVALACLLHRAAILPDVAGFANLPTFDYLNHSGCGSLSPITER